MVIPILETFYKWLTLLTFYKSTTGCYYNISLYWDFLCHFMCCVSSSVISGCLWKFRNVNGTLISWRSPFWGNFKFLHFEICMNLFRQILWHGLECINYHQSTPQPDHSSSRKVEEGRHSRNRVLNPLKRKHFKKITRPKGLIIYKKILEELLKYNLYIGDFLQVCWYPDDILG